MKVISIMMAPFFMGLFCDKEKGAQLFSVLSLHRSIYARIVEIQNPGH